MEFGERSLEERLKSVASKSFGSFATRQTSADFSEQGTALRDCLCSLREGEHKGVPGEGGPGSG